MTTYPNATHYSPHFSRVELNCHCGCKTPPLVAANLAITATNLETVRALRGGRPMSISNAYRCPARNASVNGAKDSRHMYGKAVDVYADTTTAASVDALAALAEQVPSYHKGGIGRYYNGHGFFVHMDWEHDPSMRPFKWVEV